MRRHYHAAIVGQNGRNWCFLLSQKKKTACKVKLTPMVDTKCSWVQWVNAAQSPVSNASLDMFASGSTLSLQCKFGHASPISCVHRLANCSTSYQTLFLKVKEQRIPSLNLHTKHVLHWDSVNFKHKWQSLSGTTKKSKENFDLFSTLSSSCGAFEPSAALKSCHLFSAYIICTHDTIVHTIVV
jgi:hypothetical protein